MSHIRQAHDRQTVSADGEDSLPTILIVEDDIFLAKTLANLFERRHRCRVRIAVNLKEAERALAEEPGKFFLAICDLKLPDGPQGQIFELVQRSRIPFIAITGNIEPQTRELVIQRGAMDFVPKSNPNTLAYLNDLVGRLLKNRSVKALIVDDSVSQRAVLARYLALQNIHATIVSDGREALALIQQHSDITLVITDYEMPEMNGLDLVREARRLRDKEELILIGLSGNGNKDLSSQFLKSGANDFILKPYSYEEMLCRVNQNLDMLDLIQFNREAAIKDFLTGVHNRRYFFEQGYLAQRMARLQKQEFQVAIFDIDHFKRINDTWGHDNGDLALKHVAALLRQHFAGTLLARLGGEEFAVMFTGGGRQVARERLEGFRVALEGAPLGLSHGETLRMTCSVGVACSSLEEDNLDRLLLQADQCLYRAKEGGRNQVVATWGSGA